MITFHPNENHGYWSFEGVDVFGRFYIVEAETYAELCDVVMDKCMASTYQYTMMWFSQFEGPVH